MSQLICNFFRQNVSIRKISTSEQVIHIFANQLANSKLKFYRLVIIFRGRHYQSLIEHLNRFAAKKTFQKFVFLVKNEYREIDLNHHVTHFLINVNYKIKHYGL